MTDFSSYRSQALFDPGVLGEALKRRFPVMEDDSFSTLLARFDAFEDHAEEDERGRADPGEA